MSAPVLCRGAALAAALAVSAAVPGTAGAAPAAVPPVPFAAADAANTLDLTTLPDGRVALAWTHAVSRNGVGFALRPPTDVFAAGVLQDVTAESSRVLGVVPPAGDAPYRLLRLVDGGYLRHRLTGSLLDLGTFRGRTFVDTEGFVACPDGGYTTVTQSAPSGSPASQTLNVERVDAAGQGGFRSPIFPAAHDAGEADGELFARLDLSCDGNRLVLAFNRDTTVANPTETEVLSVRIFDGAATTSTEVVAIPAVAPASHGQIRTATQPDGRVWVAYETDAQSGPSAYDVRLATAVPGGPLVTAPTATIARADLRDLAVDGTGRLLVLYDQHAGDSTDNDDPGVPTVASIEPGTTTLVTTTLPAGPDDRSREFLGGHPDGRPRLLTVFGDGAVPPADDRVEVAGLPGVPGQAADAPVLVRPPVAGEFPGTLRGTYLASGDLVAAWPNGAPSGQLVEGGIDTGTPPALGAVQAPGAVVAGEPVVLESAPSDPMGLRAVGWSANGATLDGARVRTTFAAAGTQVVTAFAEDRAGNRTETTRTIRVLPADAVSPVPAAPAATAADRRAPRITTLAQTPTRLARRATVLRVRLRVDEASAVDLELRGRVRRGGARATLVLSTARVARLAAGSTRTVRLRVPAALVRLVEAGRLDVRAIATDGAGNRGTRTVRVRRR